MIFTSRFLYDSEADTNAGGSTETATTTEAASTTETTTEQLTATESTAAAPQLPDNILKELEELRAFREANRKPDEKTPEQILKEKEQDKADFIKYAVDNDLCNIDDITKYESLKVQNDADLVFPDFLQEFKEDNTDITDEKELAEAAKEEFESKYKLSSDNEAAKARGLARLAKAAKEIRNPYESKVKEAESNYNEAKEMKAKTPAFQKFVDNQISKNAPDKVSFKIKSGEEEIPVEVELTKDDKAAIAKEFKTIKTYLNYSKSPEEAEKMLDKKIQGWIKINKFDAALAKAAQEFKKIGKTEGSNIGAENPFGLQEKARQEAIVVDLKSNHNANEARKQVVNR